jgi:hypothetical protein
MDHIPVGEIASQLPMFIDPTMIVDNVLAGYWDAADALGNSPYVGDPDGLRERKRDGVASPRPRSRSRASMKPIQPTNCSSEPRSVRSRPRIGWRSSPSSSCTCSTASSPGPAWSSIGPDRTQVSRPRRQGAP